MTAKPFTSPRRLRRAERQRSSDLLLFMVAGTSLLVLVLAFIAFWAREL